MAKKAIKFFTKREDGSLGPLYGSRHSDTVDPNSYSQIGVEQEFVPRNDRVAFSTLGLRDESAASLFLQLLNAAKNKRIAAPYIIEVEDEQTDVNPWSLDQPSERLFKKIKPIRELEEINNIDSTIDDKLREEMLSFVHVNPAFTDDTEENKDKRKSMYRIFRDKGYSFQDIQSLIERIKKHGLNQVSISYELENMYKKSPKIIEQLDELIKELEKDPEMVSDRRTKTIIDATRNKFL